LFQFQTQPGGFDTGTEDQLAWDEFRVDDVLATMEGTPAAGRRASHVTVHTATTGFDSAVAVGDRRSDHGRRSDTGGCQSVTGGRWSDTGGCRSVTAGRRSDTGGRRSVTGGRRSDTGRQSDTGCCRLVAGGHGDTVCPPASTTGRQGT
jgi:hypothetical protein